MGWVDLAGEEEVPEGGMVRAEAAGVGVLLARVDGVAYALADRCIHLGCPLSSGTLSGHIVTCRCHDWSYDLRTGEMTEASELKQRAIPLRAESGRLLANL